MRLLVSLWDKISGNFLWFIIFSVAVFIYRKLLPWIKRSWQWVARIFQKKGEYRPTAHSENIKTPMLDSVGVGFLVLAIVLLALWNRKIEHETRLLRVEMVRYVLPRQLTNDQIEAFGKYLTSHSQPHEVRIRFIQGDTEGQSYAADFAEAFRSGNWLPNMMPVSPVAVTCRLTKDQIDVFRKYLSLNSPGAAPPLTCNTDLLQMINTLEGGNIEQSGPNPPPPSTLEEKIHPPPLLSQTVTEALKAANIEGIGASYGYSEDPLNTITVFVGARRRDKWGIRPPHFDERRSTLSPNDISDDDF